MAEEETFKVTDRRHREPDPVSEPRDPQPPGAASAAPGPDEPRQPRAGDQPSPDLSALFVMFASSALISLGEAPNPETGEHERDLEHAKEAIDTLLLLRDKTQGNRTEVESQLLEDILYDLEVRFVRAARGER